MDEARLGIEADASATKAQGGIPQFSCRYARNADVDRLSEHVQTMRGNTDGRAPEKLVAPGRAIAANDVDFSFRFSNGHGQIVKQIKEALIQLSDIARPVIAQKLIEANDRGRDVLIAVAIDDVDSLVRVSVIEPQPIVRHRIYRLPRSQRGRKNGPKDNQ